MPDYPPVRRNIPSPPGPAHGKITKKPGTPKAKGAVRAKSGCYTCRIRRKVGSPLITVIITPSTTAHPLLQKCDEQPNNQGSCQTCVRLRLQCLGFGAKRPEWMRVSISLWRPTSRFSYRRPGARQRSSFARKDQVVPRIPGNDQGTFWSRPSQFGPAATNFDAFRSC